MEINNNKILHTVAGPHQGAPLLVLGKPTKKALILLHGRGGSAEDIASLYDALGVNAYTLIPEAMGNTWYPNRFLTPQAENQPALDSAISIITALLTHLESIGIKAEDTIIAGFSQGACLTAEYLKRYPTRYGGATIISGGFIGADSEAATLPEAASLSGTPVYLGCDREDAHIPLERVLQTATALTKQGAEVRLELFDGYGHRPHPTALQFLHELLVE